MIFSSRINTLLFDLDGTLIDSSEGVIGCFYYVFDRIGVPRPDPAALKATIGYPLEEAFSRFTDHDPGRCCELFQIRAREILVDSAVLLDGVRETLCHLGGHGYVLGVATTERSEHVAGILERLGVAQLFTAWSGSDEVQRVKPDPEILSLTLRKLGRPADCAAYVGDTPLDILAARSAGLLSIAVLGGTGSAEELKAAGPDALIERFAVLKRLFTGQAEKGDRIGPPLKGWDREWA